jgi:hypothetical protein
MSADDIQTLIDEFDDYAAEFRKKLEVLLAEVEADELDSKAGRDRWD